eukprot:scaffold107563_cov52-Cyclotella_meneghiniana.AAC.2
MGVPTVIVVPCHGNVIVDLDRAASDGFEYGAANDGFDEEDGAGMWQQAGGKKNRYEWDLSEEESGEDGPQKQDDNEEEDEEEEVEVEKVKPKGKFKGSHRVSDQSSYSQLSREEGMMVSSNGSSTEIDRLNAELADTKRRLEMALISCNQISEKDMSREFKEYDLQLSGIVRNVLLRYWKFFEEGMEQWSDDKDSVCQIVLSKIQMPPASTVDDEKKLWTGFLAMRLSRKFTVNRNKIVQDMRQTFFREKEPPNADAMMEVLGIDQDVFNVCFDNWREEDKALMKEFVKFLIKYAKHNAPLNKLMNLWRGAQLKAYSQNIEKEEQGDFFCMLDMLTCEDIAFTLWALNNSSEEWKLKHEGDKSDKKLQYRCMGKYSACKKKKGDDDRGVNDDGMAVFTTMVDTIDELKGGTVFADIRELCNIVAKEMGVLTEVKESETGRFKRRMDAQLERGVTSKKMVIRKSSVTLGMDSSLSGFVIAV